MDPERQFLRHTLATLAYRGGKMLRDAPPGFGATCAGAGCRPALAVLAHINDLLGWFESMARGREYWRDTQPVNWDEEVARFFTSLQRCDDVLVAEQPLACEAQRLFQGPLADALTHVGQLATLRRLAGAPVKGENYFVAEIVSGRVGAEQAPGRREFD